MAPPAAPAWLADSLQTLRDWKIRQIALLHERGWRDTTSFGPPGHVRVSVQPPLAQDALKLALRVGHI